MRRREVDGEPRSRRTIYLLTGATVVAVVAVVVGVVLLLSPRGAPSPEAALIERVGEPAEDRRVIANRRWGDGRLILLAYDRGNAHRLALGYAGRRGDDWHLVAFTEETVKSNDVVVASLLLASSEGSEGQPPWSAAAGELSDERIEKVEIRWASGDVTSAERSNGGYLVLQQGTTTPLEARYLSGDGVEIAKVPIEGSRR